MHLSAVLGVLGGSLVPLVPRSVAWVLDLFLPAPLYLFHSVPVVPYSSSGLSSTFLYFSVLLSIF